MKSVNNDVDNPQEHIDLTSHGRLCIILRDIISKSKDNRMEYSPLVAGLLELSERPFKTGYVSFASVSRKITGRPDRQGMMSDEAYLRAPESALLHHFVVSSCEAVPQNEARHHEAENNEYFFSILCLAAQADSKKQCIKPASSSFAFPFNL